MIASLGNAMYIGLATDNKATILNPIANALFLERDTGKIFRFNNEVWSVVSNADVLTGRTISLTNNTVTDTSTATGDIPRSNGTKFVRMGRGSANQFLKVNAGATNIAYEDLDVTLDNTALTTTNTKTVTNKTIDAVQNTVSNIDDDAIAAHTSTKITISNKVQLPSNTVYTSDTQTVTGKTVNLTDNTVISTGRTTGDIVKDNGTKFERFGRGTANQFLKVNAGATDIAYENLDVTLDTNAITTTNTKTLSNKTLDSITMSNGANIALGSTTGTKIGTATTERLGFYNATPVTRRAFVAAPTGGIAVDTEARAAINSLRQILIDLGFMAPS